MTEPKTDPVLIDPNAGAETFDVDAWIDKKSRPEIVVPLYPNDEAYAARLTELEAQLAKAEQTSPENRGQDDPSPETIAAQFAELHAEREASALRVRVRQLTDQDFVDLAIAASKAGVADDDQVERRYWSVAAACVEPTFTAAQLKRLHHRDRSGEAMYVQLLAAADSLLRDPEVPSLPGR